MGVSKIGTKGGSVGTSAERRGTQGRGERGEGRKEGHRTSKTTGGSVRDSGGWWVEERRGGGGRQFNRKGRMSEVRPTDASKECGGGCTPYPSENFLGALHTHGEIKLLEDLRNQESSTMVRFRGAPEKKCIMALFAKCLRISQEGTIEESLWSETSGRSLESYDAAEPDGGMCHGYGCREETTRVSTASCAGRRRVAFWPLNKCSTRH